MISDRQAIKLGGRQETDRKMRGPWITNRQTVQWRLAGRRWNKWQDWKTDRQIDLPTDISSDRQRQNDRQTWKQMTRLKDRQTDFPISVSSKRQSQTDRETNICRQEHTQIDKQVFRQTKIVFLFVVRTALETTFRQQPPTETNVWH